MNEILPNPRVDGSLPADAAASEIGGGSGTRGRRLPRTL